MNYSFITLIASNNNPRRAKILQIAISCYSDGELESQFQTFIRAVPALTKTEREFLPFNYTNIRTAEPFCDIASTIMDLIKGTQTVFKNKTDVAIFRSAFRDIGYPIGNASFVLANLLKKEINIKSELSISEALRVLNISQPISNIMDECVAMEKIFGAFSQLTPSTLPISYSKVSPKPSNKINLEDLPTTAGVYLFRDSNGNVIYVGKAINILKRVRSHFSSKEVFEKSLYQETAIVDFEETGSETIALLLESHYIQYLKPIHNTQQIEVIDPYIITSKLDSKGILRIQPIQKNYSDSENEFYYNRDSVIKTITEIQQKFQLCKRFTGIERTAKKCSDPVFCNGICQGLEDKEEYNLRVKAALRFITDQRPSYIIKLKGRNRFETGFVMVKHGIYQGYGFIDSDSSIGSIEDIEGFVRNLSHTYFSSRVIDQYHKSRKRNLDNILFF